MLRYEADVLEVRDAQRIEAVQLFLLITEILKDGFYNLVGETLKGDHFVFR